MVLWEITLATAYILGLKKTYRLALKAQRRLLVNRPGWRDFVKRRTKVVFGVALHAVKTIQQRDLELGRSWGNAILRALDRAKPSAHIRGDQPPPRQVNAPTGTHNQNCSSTRSGGDRGSVSVTGITDTNHNSTTISNMSSSRSSTSSGPSSSTTTTSNSSVWERKLFHSVSIPSALVQSIHHAPSAILPAASSLQSLVATHPSNAFAHQIQPSFVTASPATRLAILAHQRMFGESTGGGMQVLGVAQDSSRLGRVATGAEAFRSPPQLHLLGRGSILRPDIARLLQQ